MSRIISLDVRPANTPRVGQNISDRVRPRVLANLNDEGCSKDVAFLIAHPAINFLHHYLLEPLHARGRAVMTLTTRHTNNDSALLMERVIQDVGTGVRYLRTQGYKRVVLVGNSGGGPLMSLYQAQAEKLTIRTTPDGQAFDIVPEDLPPADAVVLLSAHPGRHRYFRDGLDPSVLDERDPLSADPGLDMFNARNGPPYDPAWLERYSEGQTLRQRRLTRWVLGRLRELESNDSGADDQAFIIYRTYAKPGTLDHRIDPNDRPPGDTTIFGKAKAVNYSAGVFGRYTSLRSYLSQWSELSIGDGPARLAETSVPLLYVEYSADEGCFPGETRLYPKVVGKRCEQFILKGAMHFPFLQKNGEALIAKLSEVLADWVKA
jgi:pimeloyl-ACP methyl ester carboxylesterase